MFLAALLIAIEALGTFAFGVFEITQIDTSRLVVGAGVSLLALGYGAFLVVVCRDVRRGRRWSRGPAVATQLLQGLLAYSFCAGRTWSVGLVLGALALLTLVCLLTPAATAVFVADDPQPADRG